MLVRASIITQPFLSEANKNTKSRIMQTNYAGFAQSIVLIVHITTGACTIGPERKKGTERISEEMRFHDQFLEDRSQSCN